MLSEPKSIKGPNNDSSNGLMQKSSHGLMQSFDYIAYKSKNENGDKCASVPNRSAQESPKKIQEKEEQDFDTLIGDVTMDQVVGGAKIVEELRQSTPTVLDLLYMKQMNKSMKKD